jgi:hypothetical protein
MLPSCSTAFVVERETNKKTGTTCLIPARKKPIRFAYGKVNRVRRIGAFSWGKPKKLPWVRATAAELTVCLPAKATDPKEARRLLIGGCCGGDTRPSQRLAGCRCGYTRFTPRPPIFSGVTLETTSRVSTRMVGATTDPRHGCAVNTAESASRLFRFTEPLPCRGVALTGGDAVPAPREPSAREDHMTQSNTYQREDA